MLVHIFKNNYEFHAGKKGCENKWIEVFYPVMLTIYFIFGFIVISVPGFIVGGLLNIYFGEELSFFGNITITILLTIYVIKQSKKNNKLL